MRTLLKASPLFEGVTDEDLEAITAFSMRMRCRDGQVLLVEGERDPTYLYLLTTGDVEVVLNATEMGFDRREVTFALSAPQVLGEISTILQTCRSATVRSLGEIDIIRINGKNLLDYMENHRDAGYCILKNTLRMVSDRLKGANALLKAQS